MERNGRFQFPSLRLAILKVDLPVSSQAAIGHAEGDCPNCRFMNKIKDYTYFKTLGLGVVCYIAKD